MNIFMLKLATKVTKELVANSISKKIYKKFGCRINIQINNIQIDDDDGDISIYIDANGKMNKNEFERLMERI